MNIQRVEDFALSYYPGENFFTDGSRHCVNKEKGFEYAKALYDFYANTTDEQIEDYNDMIDEELILEIQDQTIYKKPKKNQIGYVYFIESDSGYVKIGKTVNLKTRIKSLKSASPHDLKLLGYIKSEDYNFLEMVFHKKFDESRVNGEWFDIEMCRILDFSKRKKLTFEIGEDL